ncbi:MAG TPA: four helix bundle protein [Alphaproteobacteria bacterium]|nr:four helix bundle protein [Alphaproteobacteria bacterium]
MLKSYRELKVWQLSKALVADIYIATRGFPKEEIYGLASQIRRAAISIPSNIAEGHARSGTREFMHFISVAMGSLAELETQMEIAVDLSYIPKDSLAPLLGRLDEIGKMLRGLHQSLAA